LARCLPDDAGPGGRGEHLAREVAALLRAWGGAPRTLIGGDFQTDAGSPELAAMTDGTDLRSAALGGEAYPTRPDGSTHDWIFGSDGVLVTDYEVPKSEASDHYPVAVTVRIGR
jgi:endonuclease/exonuclease/phosphatase family metal-dependent hydrolase